MKLTSRMGLWIAIPCFLAGAVGAIGGAFFHWPLYLQLLVCLVFGALLGIGIGIWRSRDAN